MNPGDTIKIFYTIDQWQVEDTTTITHFDGHYLYTCGHCFSNNAKTEYGKLLFTSGFDTVNEGLETAIIEVYPQYRSSFNIPNVIVKQIVPIKNKPVYMIYKGNKIHGTIADQSIQLKNPITKISSPFYLVKCNETMPGMSGSPWYYKNILMGMHIGKTEGIVYVKPLKLYKIKF